MRIRGIVLVAALALSACAFSSERALFADGDAAQPIADGARFRWRAPDDDAMTVTFHRNGAAYDLTERDHPDEPMTGVLLIAVPETPQDDYIVQWRDEDAVEGRIYAFMWPVGAGYQVYSDPDAFEGQGDGPKPGDAFCQRRAYGECMFRARADLIAYYQTIVYPRLNSDAEAPEGYLELTPIADGRRAER
jgi:hypothetical protein